MQEGICIDGQNFRVPGTTKPDTLGSGLRDTMSQALHDLKDRLPLGKPSEDPSKPREFTEQPGELIHLVFNYKGTFTSLADHEVQIVATCYSFRKGATGS